MKYLGIDYGKSKIGLAISEGQIASPLEVVAINSLVDALAKVENVIVKEGINRVVVGVPESGEAEKIARKFIHKLDIFYKNEIIEVIAVDETLSSHDAKELMKDLNLNRKKRREEDAYAAVIILQNFLDSLQ